MMQPPKIETNEEDRCDLSEWSLELAGSPKHRKSRLNDRSWSTVRNAIYGFMCALESSGVNGPEQRAGCIERDADFE